MSNNIYDILGKLQSIEPKQEPTVKETAQRIYESVEAKGSIIEGVTKVEQNLSEKYMGFKNEDMIGKAKAFGGKLLNKLGHGSDEDLLRDLHKKSGGDPKVLAKMLARQNPGDPAGNFTKGGKALGIFKDSVDEGDTTDMGGGRRVHKGSYGTAYQGDAGDEASPDSPKKRGRPAKGTTKKVDPDAEKRGRGRPKKDATSDMVTPKGDIFGRTTGSVPKGKKGSVHKLQDSLDEATPPVMEKWINDRKTDFKKRYGDRWQEVLYATAWKQKKNESVAEGVNYSRLLQDTHADLDECMSQINDDIMSFKESGLLSEKLKDLLMIHKHLKQEEMESFNPMMDMAVTDDVSMEQHYGPMTPLTDDLDTLAQLAGLTREAVDTKKFAALAPPKDKITYADKIAGAKQQANEDDVDEGNDFSEKVVSLKAQGAKPGTKFKTSDGKEHVLESVQNSDAKIDECGMAPVSGYGYEGTQSRMNVSTNISSDGTKNITVSADGEQAEALMQILQLAGMGTGKLSATAQSAPAQEAEVDEAEGSYANEPDEKIASTNDILDQGDDLNKSKMQDPETANRAANPLTKKTFEENEAISKLGANLMSAYESIKVKK
jgi:hypothetical protein